LGFPPALLRLLAALLMELLYALAELLRALLKPEAVLWSELAKELELLD